METDEQLITEPGDTRLEYPADWYPNPDDPTGRWLRYWDGSAWIDQTRLASKKERETLTWPEPSQDAVTADVEDSDEAETAYDAAAKAGWYQENDRWLRYWDGSKWTDDRHPAGQVQGGNAAFHPRGQGKLGTALQKARAAGDTQAVASFWLGIVSVACFLIAIPTKVSALAWAALIAGIAGIITARFVRDRARQADDAGLLYLSRYGQIMGWSVVGIFVFVILIFAAFLGSFLGSASS